MTPRIPLAYTFGNHMHWVDMQWLWGYDVLPGSTEDMLAYCTQAGVKGNVNFDGIGYEKMASESPEHLAMLRGAIKAGTVEVVGGSYGQPYGLFHGGESNIRQRVYGVRTAMRVLGTRPRTFWEEEFDLYPQLPQMLAGCGFTGASLYFQWTWHTPEIPMEDAPVVLWEGIDGTRLPTVTRNRMNLHQWPEDFRILLDDLAANPPEGDDIPHLVLQWLELMPTQDWMCRSALMLPMLAELKKDPRFEVIALTLGEYLAKWEGQDLPVRQYKLDNVWHGMTLGKNGDNHPKRSADLQERIMDAETACAILGLFGRPYDPWDVYPTWELEECWRKLLAAQHHDNHECEGLCGHVAEAQFAYIESLLGDSQYVHRLAKRVGLDEGDSLALNRNGWPISTNGVSAPSMGYQIVQEPESELVKWTIRDNVARFEEGGMRVLIDLKSGTILELKSKFGSIRNLPIQFTYRVNGQQCIANEINSDWGHAVTYSGLEFAFLPEGLVSLNFLPRPDTGELEIGVSIDGDLVESGLIDPGYSGSVRLQIPSLDKNEVIRADGPYSVQKVGTGSSGKRKYPVADWMTSPQWFEDVTGAFTSQSFVDLSLPDGDGLLITHSGSQQWFRTANGIESVLLAIDPWDEQNFESTSHTVFRLCPHRGLSNADCAKRAKMTLGHPKWNGTSLWPLALEEGPLEPSADSPPLPRDFSAISVHAPNVLATAFYREQESFCKRDLLTYAGEGMGHPYILRLVEYDGIGGEVEITLPGPIAKAFKTNLMGEIEEKLSATPDDVGFLTSEPEKLIPFGIEAARVKLAMRPYEIATIYLDIIPGRKQFRDLDAKREIWATVHRTED